LYWNDRRIKRHINTISALQLTTVLSPKKAFNTLDPYEYDDRSFFDRKFYERVHKVNSVHVETLDDDLNDYALYKVMEEAINISDFEVAVSSKYGIDLDSISQTMNLDVSANEIISLFTFNVNNPKAVDEIIEQEVKDIIKDMTIGEIVNYQQDANLLFYNIESTKQVKPEERRLMNKQSTSILKGLLMGLVSFFLF